LYSMAERDSKKLLSEELEIILRIFSVFSL
jgi:hypothetical protein